MSSPRAADIIRQKYGFQPRQQGFTMVDLTPQQKQQVQKMNMPFWKKAAKAIYDNLPAMSEQNKKKATFATLKALDKIGLRQLRPQQRVGMALDTGLTRLRKFTGLQNGGAKRRSRSKSPKPVSRSKSPKRKVRSTKRKSRFAVQ